MIPNRLMDVKQGVNKNGNTVLYLVFEYMETDLKKFIRSYRQTGESIPPQVVKVQVFKTNFNKSSFLLVLLAINIFLWLFVYIYVSMYMY